jgi:hypothetical protein
MAYAYMQVGEINGVKVLQHEERAPTVVTIVLVSWLIDIVVDLS